MESQYAQLLQSARASARKLVTDLEQRRDEPSLMSADAAGRPAIEQALAAAKNVLRAIDQRTDPAEASDS